MLPLNEVVVLGTDETAADTVGIRPGPGTWVISRATFAVAQAADYGLASGVTIMHLA